MKSYFILLCALLCGCVNEDLSDCPPVVRGNNVKIDFQLLDGGLFTDDVTRVTAVLFNGQGAYIPPTFDLDEASLADYAGLEMQLDPGDYRMVFWANVGDNTEIKVVDGTPMVVYKNADERVVGNGDPVWYAPAVEATRTDADAEPLDYYEFTVPEGDNFSDAVNFTETHNTVNVYLQGMTFAADAMPSVELTNLASAADFYGMAPLDNPLPTCTSCVQTAPAQLNDTNCVLAAFETSPLGDMTGMYLVLKDAAGNEIFRTPLADAVAQSGADPSDHEINIVISFTQGNFNGTIEILDWNELGLGSEF